jgi:hypothetical protein
MFIVDNELPSSSVKQYLTHIVSLTNMEFKSIRMLGYSTMCGCYRPDLTHIQLFPLHFRSVVSRISIFESAIFDPLQIH